MKGAGLRVLVWPDAATYSIASEDPGHPDMRRLGSGFGLNENVAVPRNFVAYPKLAAVTRRWDVTVRMYA